MDQPSTSSLTVQLRNLSRSMGLKLLVVCALALFMTIPSLFVNSVVEERNTRAKGVIDEINGRAGGQQTFLGPTLSIPYSIPSPYKGRSPVPGLYEVFPAKGDASIKVRTEESAADLCSRFRSIRQT